MTLPRSAPGAHVAAKKLLLAFGEEVRRRRLARRLSQHELARRAGLHGNYISLIERGNRSPSLVTLAALAGAFGTTIADLVRVAEKRIESRTDVF